MSELGLYFFSELECKGEPALGPHSVTTTYLSITVPSGNQGEAECLQE